MTAKEKVMAGMLEGKVVIISGSGRGIGRAGAIICASRGAKVVVNDVGAGLSDQNTDQTPAQEVVDFIKKAGGQAVANYDSVAGWDSAHKIVQCALDTFGRVDGIVNNAGILRDRMFHNMSEQEWDDVMQVHLFGSFYLSRAAIPHFRKQESGAFVFMSSTSGLLGNVGQANYGAAKMGMVGMSNSLTMEGKKYNIRSNVIAPGANTRMTQSVPSARRGGEEAQKKRLEALPPESPGAMMAFLLSDAAKDVQGQIFGARGTDMMLFGHPRPIRYLHRDPLWDTESLAEALPAFDSYYTKMGSGRAFMPWDPPAAIKEG
jgi:NAD(P)-dependent dehydrogenase (short-subunit alcohol dehydrogenase family)